MDWMYFSIQWRFHKNYNEENDEGYFLEVDLEYSEKSHELHNGLSFLPEEMKIENVEKLVFNLLNIKQNMLFTKKFKASIKSWISF